MKHKLKIKVKFFQPLIDGKKPFEIRLNDRNFQVGDEVLLEEYEGERYVDECPYLMKPNRFCGWVINEDIPEYGEEEAIDACGRKRLRCGEHIEKRYTGRQCLIKIKDIFPLFGAGEALREYVAFTFEILGITNVYNQKIEVELI